MAAEELRSHLERVVRDARRALEESGREWALVGGLAVSARAEPRFTRDADLAVAVEGDAEAEALARELRNRGYELLEIVEQKATGRVATARFQPPGGEEHGVVLDLLFASSGIEPEIVRRASSLEVFPDLELPVATLADLLAAKILARDDRRRPQDAVDIRSLLDRATPEDLAAAREALRTIAERGFHRGKNLEAELDRHLCGSEP